MSRTLLIVSLASLVACAGRTNPPVEPARAAIADAGETRSSAPATTGERDEPTYGELMRGEAPMYGTMAQAEMRRFLAPLRTIKPSACAPVDDPAFWACWCRLVCGLRFDERSAATTIRWPFGIVAGPGLTVEPDGHVSACWHTERDVPETRVTCPAR